MARLQRNPLMGIHAYQSMFFLKDNGFTNVEICSDKSVWVGNGVSLYIDRDEVVTDYKKLFNLIYDSGMNYGKYVERNRLVDATTYFIKNYGRDEQCDY
jgi:hypothetical protein